MSNKLNLAALLDRLELSGLSPSGIFVCPLCRHKVHYPECPFIALRAARADGYVEALLSREAVEMLRKAMATRASFGSGDDACRLLARDLDGVLKGDRS
jgi:hypothetical protein